MATTYHTEIQKLYVAYFNRPADFGGLNYWEGVVEAAGGSTAAVSAAFAASAEYQAEYGGMSNADVINQIYINLFGRAAEPSGLAYWANGITAGNFTIDTAVTAIAGGAQGTDKVAYDSKVTFASAFTAALDTPAEQTGYSGDLANEAAKEIVADIKTAADLAAAIAPAALNASVAAVVDAATPFTLVSGLAALEAANEAKEAFLEDADMTDLEIDGLVAAAVADLDDEVTGYAAATPNVAAALLADEIDARAELVADEEEQYQDALDAAAEVEGLTDAIAAADAADANVEVMIEAQTEAEADLAAALASYNVKNSVALTVAADGTVAGVIDLVDGELVLADDITEEDNPGVTALLAASIAQESADLDVAAAEAAAFQAALFVDMLDDGGNTVERGLVGDGITLTAAEVEDVAEPTFEEIVAEIAALKAVAAETAAVAAEDDATAGEILAATNAATAVTDFIALVQDFMDADADALSQDVTDEAEDVADAVEAVDALTAAVDAVAEAEAIVAERDALDTAIADAIAAFGDAELAEPKDLTAFVVATAGSDIYLAGDVATSTVISFGDAGTDSLFIGTDYTLNTGALSTGNNSVLEVFMIQSGTSVKVYLETEVYGSASAATAEQVITLTGVTLAELTLANGIITAA